VIPTEESDGGSLDARALAAYQAETRKLVSSRLPAASVVLLTLMAIAYAIEWVYFPDRLVLLTISYTVYLGVCVAGVVLGRTFPRQGLPLTVLVTVVLVLCLTLYIVVAHRSAELCLLGLIAFLTGVVVQFPWGAVGQSVVGITALVAFGGALASGIEPVLPVPYETFALAAHIGMTVLGAHLLERYRFHAFREAVEADRHAEESARANAAKSEFLATVSHELRTPLNIIVGYTDLLIEGAFSPDEAADALKRMRHQSRELLDLIQAMLDLNRVEEGGFPLTIEEFSIATLFESLRGGLPAGWSRNGVVLAWEAQDEGFLMRSDRAKLEMILRNLIHNALKYTDVGTITVGAEPESGGEQIRFTVVDTGQGIAADDLSRIFEMFAQGKDGPARGGGVGLGLFIVSRLTAALGGRVSVESQQGAGSRFTITLPTRAPERRSTGAGFQGPGAGETEP
jgi:signal transduction histidine kinase